MAIVRTNYCLCATYSSRKVRCSLFRDFAIWLFRDFVICLSFGNRRSDDCPTIEKRIVIEISIQARNPAQEYGQ